MKYLIFLLLSFNLNAAEWSKEDQQRQLLYTFVHVLDWAQTLDIVRKADSFYETNKILGRHPTEKKVNIFMVSTLIGNWFIAKKLGKRNRKTFQLVSISTLSLVIVRNNYLGLSIRF